MILCNLHIHKCRPVGGSDGIWLVFRVFQGFWLPKAVFRRTPEDDSERRFGDYSSTLTISASGALRLMLSMPLRQLAFFL